MLLQSVDLRLQDGEIALGGAAAQLRLDGRHPVLQPAIFLYQRAIDAGDAMALLAATEQGEQDDRDQQGDGDDRGEISLHYFGPLNVASKPFETMAMALRARRTTPAASSSKMATPE